MYVLLGISLSPAETLPLSYHSLKQKSIKQLDNKGLFFLTLVLELLDEFTKCSIEKSGGQLGKSRLV